MTTASAIDESRSTNGSKPVQDDRLVVRRAVAVVDLAEIPHVRCSAERLHDAHAGDVLRERRRHEAEPFAHRGTRGERVRKIAVAIDMSGMRRASRARAASRG